VSLPGVAFASADTNEYFTFTNTYIPVTSNPDALKFFCSFMPQNNDTGFATIRVFDDMMNEIGSGTYIIDKALLTYQEISVPVDYTSQADAAYIQVQFSSAQEGSKVSLGTVMYIDDVSVVNLTAMTNDWLLNPIDVYPNPSSDIIHIQMPVTSTLKKVIIYNSLGQKIIENSSLDFSINSLSTGVHYIDIQTTEGIYHKKFIKK
jgi:hypothetical protein